jgi:hypothetical protein
MLRRLRALPEGESLAPWVAAPVLAVVLLVIAMSQVPGTGCGEDALRYVDDTGPRDVVIGLATFESVLLGLAAVCLWSAQRNRVGDKPLGSLPVAAAILGPPLLALALTSSSELVSGYAIVGFAGSAAAVAGLFASLRMWVRKVRPSEASFYLPLYLGATAWFLIPFLAIASLVLTRHPICELG